MSTDPKIIVAGLGRCGTSMVCQMLAAGGLRVAGQWPSYETAEPWNETGWQVAKLLDPHRQPLGEWMRGSLVFWLNRKPMEQAASQSKLLGEIMSREDRKLLAGVLRHDRRLSERRLRMAGHHPLVFDFERILRMPYQTADELEHWLKEWFGYHGFRADRAAGVVNNGRSSACAPDLSMEHRLIVEGPPEWMV
jgi:hypothetical protein